MQTAIFLHIDPDIIQSKIERIGGEKVFDRMERVHVYDYEDLHLSKAGVWLRLRDEGDRVMLSYREKVNEAEEHAHHKGEEVDVEVDNFNGINFVLQKVGLRLQFIEEKRRLQYKREGLRFTIEYMPGIEPYLEIADSDEDHIAGAASELDLTPEEGKRYTTFQIYQEAGININDFSELTFAHMEKRHS